MAQVAKHPAFINRLVKTMRDEIAGATVDCERIEKTNRFRLAVASEKFRRMSHPRRQNFVWDLAERVLTPDELLKVGMILTLLPEEIESMD